MKKTKLLLLLVIFSLSIFAQNINVGKVEYLEIVNIDNVPFIMEQWEDNIHSLYFTPTKSIYKYDKSDEIKFVTGTSGNGGHSAHLYYHFIFHTNFNTGILTSSEYKMKGPYLTKENKAKIDWEINKETKQIGEYLCNQATCKFRGRIYTAWFTPKIPSSAGPWKLQGLPGLILEAYDNTRQVQYLFNSVQYPYKSTKSISMKAPTKSKNNKINSPKELTRLYREDIDNFLKRLRANMPEGGTIEVEEIKINRIELEFEEGLEKGIKYGEICD